MDSPGKAQNGLGDLGDEANAPGALGHNEDDRNRPKGLQNASELERTQPEQSEEEYSLGRPPDRPNAPDNEAAIPGDLQGTQGCPIGDRDTRGSEMIVSSQGTRPGGYRGDQETRRGVEVNLGHKNVIKRAEYNGIRTTSNKNVHIIETNPSIELQGREAIWAMESSWEVSGAIKSAETMAKVADAMQNKARWMAQRAAHATTQRLRARSLAVAKTSQHERYQCDMTDIPRPSTAPPSYPRPPTDRVKAARARQQGGPREKASGRARVCTQTQRSACAYMSA